jgi:integrase/recombinase XerD
MPTVKAFLDTRYKSKDNTFPVTVRVSHGSQTPRDFPTGWKIEEKFWNEDEREVKSKHPESSIINGRIAELVNQAKSYFAECQLKNRPIKLDLIGKARQSYNWNEYILRRADQYGAKEMIIMERKARRCDRELRVFNTPGLTYADLMEDERLKRPLRGNTIYMDDITPDLLRRFEAFLVKQGNVNNTRAKKFEFLGNWYQDAIKEKMVDGPNHFRAYKIQEKPVKKEKLTEAEVKAIEDLQLQLGAVNDARNLWLFSYYCKGIRFESCITCKCNAIQNGRVFVHMNKGEKHISIKIHPRLRAIIDYYQGNSEFLFPYIKELPAGRKEYLKIIDSRNVIVNRNLKIVAELAGIKTKITFHIARHSFASHLKDNSDNIHVIKEALGHSDSRTTEIYLKALGDERLDKEMDKLYGE